MSSRLRRTLWLCSYRVYFEIACTFPSSPQREITSRLFFLLLLLFLTSFHPWTCTKKISNDTLPFIAYAWRLNGRPFNSRQHEHTFPAYRINETKLSLSFYMCAFLAWQFQFLNLTRAQVRAIHDLLKLHSMSTQWKWNDLSLWEIFRRISSASALSPVEWWQPKREHLCTVSR